MKKYRTVDFVKDENEELLLILEGFDLKDKLRIIKRLLINNKSSLLITLTKASADKLKKYLNNH